MVMFIISPASYIQSRYTVSVNFADLPCMHTPILAAIQFRLLAPVPTANFSEPQVAVTRVDVGLMIQLELEPVTAILQDIIVVSVSGTSGTATRKSSLVHGCNCQLIDQNQLKAKTTRQL